MAGSVRRTFGVHVRALRQERGLTQEALAERSGLSVEAVGRVERGRLSPTLETLEKLAQGLEMGFAELFLRFQDKRPGRVAEVCEFLSRLSYEEIDKVWHVLRILFAPSEGKQDLDLGS